MATEKSALRITELDHDTIKANLKEFLRSQDEFQDFDFEGAGMNVLLEILAYNTHYQAFYLNMIGNEMFLDTAQIRPSIISHAKLMNYVPGSKQGSLARINIQATPSDTEDQNVTALTLNKYTRLLGQDIDGINYPFVTLNANTAIKSAGSFNWSNVYIKQGEVVTLQYEMNAGNESRRFEIPSDSVDTTTLSILVQESSTNNDTMVYTLATDITELTSNSKVYFVEENENLNYTFYFGDNIIGKRPKNGNIIMATYLDTSGEGANNISEFTFIEPIGGKLSDNVTITAQTSTYGGIDKEDIESVRFRAPYFYTTQNRAVNVHDYDTLILKDFNTIDSVSTWGGEDNDPVVYGKVFISLKTKGNYHLTNFEKERIKDSLITNRNVLTVTPEIVDPDYTYFMISGKVYFDANRTTYTAEEITTLVNAAVLDYASNELNSFNVTFRKSALTKYIEACDKSITGSDIDVVLQKRLDIDTTRTRTYTIKFNTPLVKSVHGVRLSTFPELQIYDAGGVLRRVFIEETPEIRTGIESIHITDQGMNYTTAPTVTILGDGSGAIATATVLSGRIDRIELSSAGTNYTSAVVELTGGDGHSGAAVVVLESQVGTLRTYYYSSNREKIILNPNAGSINYTTGTIILDSLTVNSVIENDFYDDDVLTISVPAQDENVYTVRNNILVIDEDDAKSIQISVIAE